MIFYTVQLKGDRSRGVEVESTQVGRRNEQESRAQHSLVMLHSALTEEAGVFDSSEWEAHSGAFDGHASEARRDEMYLDSR